MACDLTHSRCKRGQVASLERKPVIVIFDQIGGGSDLRTANKRQPGGGFGDDDAPGLVVTRENKHIRSAIDCGQRRGPIDEAEEVNAIAKRRDDEGSEAGSFRSVTCNYEVPFRSFGRQGLEGGNQQIDPLHGRQTTGIENSAALRRETEFPDSQIAIGPGGRRYPTIIRLIRKWKEFFARHAVTKKVFDSSSAAVHNTAAERQDRRQQDAFRQRLQTTGFAKRIAVAKQKARNGLPPAPCDQMKTAPVVIPEKDNGVGGDLPQSFLYPARFPDFMKRASGESLLFALFTLSAENGANPVGRGQVPGSVAVLVGEKAPQFKIGAFVGDAQMQMYSVRSYRVTYNGDPDWQRNLRFP